MKNIKLFEAFNDYQIKLALKKRAKERLDATKKEIDDTIIPEDEIKDILIAIKSKKYPILDNMDKALKLQKMGLIKKPNAVQTASSFSFPFYLTSKGEKTIK